LLSRIAAPCSFFVPQHSTLHAYTFWGYVAVCVQLYCRWFTVSRLVFPVLHYMFRSTWPSSGVYDVLFLYSWRNLLRCFWCLLLHVIILYTFPSVGWVKYDVFIYLFIYATLLFCYSIYVFTYLCFSLILLCVFACLPFLVVCCCCLFCSCSTLLRYSELRQWRTMFHCPTTATLNWRSTCEVIHELSQAYEIRSDYLTYHKVIKHRDNFALPPTYAWVSV
jgi:hypothetical protein